MIFTDDDMKRLNYWIQFPDNRVDVEQIKALLARLEAAEKIHKYAKHWKQCKGIDDTCECGFSDVENAWCKTKTYATDI